VDKIVRNMAIMLVVVIFSGCATRPVDEIWRKVVVTITGAVTCGAVGYRASNTKLPKL